MTRRRLWTEHLDAVLLNAVAARGKKSITKACKSLKRRDVAFDIFTAHAMMRHYEKLRHRRELDLEDEDWEEEGHGDLRPVKYSVIKMMNIRALHDDGSAYTKTAPKTIGDVFVDNPPSKDDIEALLAPQYGGGEYIVINQTTKKVYKRFRFDGPAKDPDAPVAFPGKSLSPIVRMLDDDKRPLIKALLLLPEARDNLEAWNRIFPRVLKAAEGVCADVDAARKDIDAASKEIEKVAFAARFVQTMQADNLEAVMDKCDAALERNKLVDRELKKEN